LTPLGLTSVSRAAQVVAPILPEVALSSGLNTTVRNAPRVYEEFLGSNNFSSITQPSLITGMQFRLAIGENWRPLGYVGSTWPDQAITFTQYDVQLSKPSATLVSQGEYLSLTPTFASYQDGGLTTVRSGPLTLPANSFAADGAIPATDIHSFGPTITFTTPYAYTPGDGIVMLIRLSGYGATGTPLQAFVGSADFLNGTADAISSTASATAAAPNGFSSPVFVQFTHQPVPEPAGLMCLAAVTLTGLMRRSRRG
jgi:hypothetical protein